MGKVRALASVATVVPPSGLGYCTRCGGLVAADSGVGGMVGRCRHGDKIIRVPLVSTEAEADAAIAERRRLRRHRAPTPDQDALDL